MLLNVFFSNRIYKYTIKFLKLKKAKFFSDTKSEAYRSESKKDQ